MSQARDAGLTLTVYQLSAASCVALDKSLLFFQFSCSDGKRGFMTHASWSRDSSNTAPEPVYGASSVGNQRIVTFTVILIVLRGPPESCSPLPKTW